ncbi:MAG: regulatory protein RecX [Halieaceae bacterium]|jgi:regulatory protein|nr:regulatory protein RecX [Halieaceae bacterium]
MENINPNDIRLSAMNLLARREHLQSELRQKLTRRFGEAQAPAVDAVLLSLAEENLQSDQRYLESYIRQRSARGYGPLRLRQELRQKGVNAEALEDGLAAAQADWFALAREARLKKFGNDMPADFKEKARQMRYLLYRGFSNEQASAALDGDGYC